MLLFHSTPGANSYGISSLGVCVENARVSPRRIFLHTWRKRKWARLHLAVRYKCDPRQITSFAVDVPRLWVRKFTKGLWTCERTIPARCLVGQTFFLEAAELTDETLIGFDFDLFSAPGHVPASGSSTSDQPRQLAP